RQPPAADPSETFSYRDYLARQDIHVQVWTKDVAVLSSHHGNPVLDHLLRFKARAYDVVQDLLPEPQGALLAGILLGIERDLPPDLVEAFRITGTSHIVAISGMNLAIIAGFVNQWARRIFRRRGSLALSLGIVWVYVVLVGASPSVLRAGVMSSIVMLALREQRLVHGPTALAAAVVALSLLDPFTFWDLGFQLSFAATVALMIYVPLLGGWVKRRLGGWLGRDRAEKVVGLIWETVIVTLAVQVATLGITVGVTGELSLVSLLTNSLILPAQPFVMTFGGLALLLGFVIRPLGVVFGWLAWVFLWYTITIVEWTATFPWAFVKLGTMTPFVVWTYYGLLALATGWVMLSPAVRLRLWGRVKALDRRLAAAGVAGLVLVGGYFATRPDGRLHVCFLDVGHGTAVFLQTPTGSQVLIDGGPDPRQTLSELGKQMPFWDRSLDLVLLTSPDNARLAGLVPVLARYDVASVVVGPEAGTGPTWEAWEAALQEQTITPANIVAGAVRDLDGGVSLHTLWPPNDVEGPVVLQIVHGNVRFLLMGDATALVEDRLVAAYGQQLRSSVLELARQGAQTSTSVALLQAASPDFAVVSRSDRYDLSPYIEARLMDRPLYRTDANGTITFLSDGRGIVVKPAH
ncbi:MAG: ComEC/Rec2 family competence protein, partial [Anaerolineae bacterium]|nr:ComEC/Rec2 family competence protein [Anaerolineae bacterium]